MTLGNLGGLARLGVLAAAAVAALCVNAHATVVTTTDPSISTDIGARIRWGNTGFEASLFDANTLNQAPTLNPTGTPVWQLNLAYTFRVSFDSLTGILGLDIDFSRDNAFGTGESITRSVFAAPGLTSYLGKGFTHLSISGNEGGSTARSTVSNLVINGDSQSPISPGGAFVESFFKDSSNNPMTSITITGSLTFLTLGTSQERPSWNFNFKGPADPAAPVPLPAAFPLLAGALGGLGLFGLGKRLRKAS